MTITIDFSNVYVILTITFFALLWLLGLALQIKIVLQKRQLLKQAEASPQLEAALDIIETLAAQLEGATVFMGDDRNRDGTVDLVRRARTIVDRLKKDANI